MNVVKEVIFILISVSFGCVCCKYIGSRQLVKLIYSVCNVSSKERLKLAFLDQESVHLRVGLSKLEQGAETWRDCYSTSRDWIYRLLQQFLIAAETLTVPLAPFDQVTSFGNLLRGAIVWYSVLIYAVIWYDFVLEQSSNCVFYNQFGSKSGKKWLIREWWEFKNMWRRNQRILFLHHLGALRIPLRCLESL